MEVGGGVFPNNGFFSPGGGDGKKTENFLPKALWRVLFDFWGGGAGEGGGKKKGRSGGGGAGGLGCPQKTKSPPPATISKKKRGGWGRTQEIGGGGKAGWLFLGILGGEESWDPLLGTPHRPAGLGLSCFARGQTCVRGPAVALELL